jgi:molybdopterin converting factor subunit 1
MTVHILCFGVVKEICGAESFAAETPEDATVASLLNRLCERFSALSTLRGSIAVAVNQQYADGLHKLNAGDEVALLPPVSGGVHSAMLSVALTREPIVPASFRNALAAAEDGAVCAFEGIVRNNSRGRETLFLDYEAYEEMALKQMRELAARAQADFGVHGVVVVHRLGRLHVGECSVFIAVASAHRAEAFAACRWLIDTLKSTVPIWKKEHFTDGAEWAAGEPFPEAVVAR